ncbi:MAG: CoA-binding protein [Silicimonas sp.]|nr:CoA-binding protein [Silicimonas sp.]
MNYSDDFLRRVLEETKVIAMVGASTNKVRASYFVASYFNARGRRIIPVNPAIAGETLFGETVVSDLSEIDCQVDMVDIFRRSDQVPDIVDAAIAHLMPGLKSVWMQFNIVNEDAAARAEAEGLDVVMNRCTKVEYARLMREIGAVGIPSRVISSKLTRRI